MPLTDICNISVDSFWVSCYVFFQDPGPNSSQKLFRRRVCADKEVCLYISHPVQDPAAAAKIIGACKLFEAVSVRPEHSSQSNSPFTYLSNSYTMGCPPVTWR